jgi:16S rRNA (cytosine967-C5)-methyltransferase
MAASRRAAAFVVHKWLATGDYPSGMLGEDASRAFVQDMVYTTVRRLRPLRKILGMLVKRWPKGELEALLYVGAAQILYMPGVPDFAAVNETVEAAKKCSNPNVARVVNGTLRSLLRRREEFEKLLADAPADERESFPGELYRRWAARFGAEGAERLMVWHNEPAKTFLAYPDRYEELPRGCRVAEVEGFAEGRFVVQDPATGLAVEQMEIEGGDKVLDACAAPGGKTIQMAWRGAEVVAMEVNKRRRRRLDENLRRTGLDGKVRCIGSFDEAKALAPFSKVLVDAPCSNSGVLRRRPDARWNWSEKSLSQLVKLQAEILDGAAELVAPGGRLVYSTCSNECDENQNQIAAFLERHPDFSLASSRESIPFETGWDGAFAAAMVRSLPA